jgi:hypothetical protein
MDNSVMDWSTDTVRVRLWSDDATGDDGRAIGEKP